jgi:hypothetical protein
MRGMNDICLDCQVVVNEIGGEGIIGINPADLGGGKDDSIRTILLQPDFDTHLMAQIDDAPVCLEDLVPTIGEISGDGGSDHAFVTRYPNSSAAHSEGPIVEIERFLSHQLAACYLE